jgi:site-specific DNA-methyltransferase (adenine-specific)
VVPGGAAALLDAQSGESTSPKSVTRGGKRGLSFGMNRQDAVPCPGDSGGASRFFYCAKASRSEREAGLEALSKRSGADAVERVEGSAGTKSPRAGAGRTASTVANFHPTVKPVALMRWLVRLATPKGGVVLDPFMGSGSTGIAAKLEGFDFLGIDLDPDYVRIAQARIDHAGE